MLKNKSPEEVEQAKSLKEKLEKTIQEYFEQFIQNKVQQYVVNLENEQEMKICKIELCAKFLNICQAIIKKNV
jgi:hypothetical protein